MSSHDERTPGEELSKLRFSLAKVACALGLASDIPGSGDPQPDDKHLRDMAFHQHRGWNRLVRKIGERATVDLTTARSLNVMACEVADGDLRFKQALDKELNVEAQVLTSLLSSIAPAIPSLSFRIPSGMDNGQLARFERRGFFLTDDGVLGKRLDSHGPSAFYVTPEMGIRRVTYEGRGANWKVASDTESDVIAVLKECDLKDVVDHLRTALHKQLAGNKAERIKLIYTRAEKLEKLAYLFDNPYAIDLMASLATK